MKGLEKLTSIRLAEALTQRGNISSEAITDALYAQDKQGEPFATVMVGGGHVTEWDMAKLVAEIFQLPFLMPSNYMIDEKAKAALPKNVLFQHQIVPLDVFDNVISVVMPILTPFDVLLSLQKDHNCEIFPYVGLISENKKVLGELHKDYQAWCESEAKRKEADANKKAKSNGDWMSIFDAGDQAIQDGRGKKK